MVATRRSTGTDYRLQQPTKIALVGGWAFEMTVGLCWSDFLAVCSRFFGTFTLVDLLYLSSVGFSVSFLKTLIVFWTMTDLLWTNLELKVLASGVSLVFQPNLAMRFMEFSKPPGNACHKSRASELRASTCMTKAWEVGQKVLLRTCHYFFSPSKTIVKHWNILKHRGLSFQKCNQTGLGNSCQILKMPDWNLVSGDVRSQLQAVHCLWESVQSGVVLPGAGLTHGSMNPNDDNPKGFGR